MDTGLLGNTAAMCMESMENHEDLQGGRISAVLLVVVAEDEDATRTITRVYSSESTYWKQLGLVAIGSECIVRGENVT